MELIHINADYIERTTCRLCGGQFKDVLNLGAIHVSNFVDTSDTPSSKVPINLVECVDCHILQLRHTVSGDILYRNAYWYKSSLNMTMVDALKDVCNATVGCVNIKHGDIIVDIGSNDGTLLGHYPIWVREHCWLMGFEPSNLAKESEGKAHYIINDYFNAPAYNKIFVKKAKIVTSIAMFYDLEDPHAFIEQVKSILADDGVWTIQLMDLLSMLRTNDFPNLCLGENELITTEIGLKKIIDVNEGEKVLTHRGRFRTVTKKFVNTFADNTLIRLKSYGNGFDLKVTPNHPIWVKRGSWQFISASDVKLGDIVGKPVVYDAPEYTDSVITENVAKIIGYYLSEGSFNTANQSASFYFNIDEEHTLVADLVNALKTEGHSANIYYAPQHNVIYVNTYRSIAPWLNQHFGHLAHKKHIPMWVLSLESTLQKTIFDTYMAGDGYVYRKNYYRASTVSQDLAYGISLIANRLGYKCSLCEQQVSENDVISGRAVHQKNLWDILVHTAPTQKQKVWIEDGIQCSRIKELELVEYLGENVYNLEVEEDHSFVTPAMTTHNCHEHLEYYKLIDIAVLMAQHGLQVFNAEYNTVNGASLRVYIGHTNAFPVTKEYFDAIDAEHEFLEELGDIGTYFKNAVENVKSGVMSFIKYQRSNNKTIALLGSSTKANTVLQYFNITSDDLDHAAEVNPDKYGKHTVGTNIPIISEQESLQKDPDFYLIAAWGFLNMFIQKLMPYLQSGGAFIVPLPEPRIIDLKDGELHVWLI